VMKKDEESRTCGVGGGRGSGLWGGERMEEEVEWGGGGHQVRM
jgi:hypothetical protein